MQWDPDLSAQVSRDLAIAFYALASMVLTHLAHVIVGWVKKRRKGHFSFREFQASAREEVKIRQIIINGRERVGGCCGFFGLIHNGGETAGGKKMMRTTRLYEEPDDQTIALAGKFSGDLIASLPGLNELIIDEGASFTLVEKLPVGKLRWFLERSGRKAIAVGTIMRGDLPLGYVSFEFKTEAKPDNLESEMEIATYQIGQILMRYDAQ